MNDDEYLLQFWRRTIVRTLFSNVECITYYHKKLSLYVSEISEVNFTNAEASLLNEISYSLNDKGEAKDEKAKLRTVDNLLFSARMFAKSLKMNFELDKSKPEWGYLVMALKIRDRLTHPKGQKDLIVTDKDMPIIISASQWFHREIVNKYQHEFNNFLTTELVNRKIISQ